MSDRIVVDLESNVNREDPEAADEWAAQRERYWNAQINRFQGKDFAKIHKIKKGKGWTIRLTITPKDTPEYRRFINNLRSIRGVF